MLRIVWLVAVAALSGGVAVAQRAERSGQDFNLPEMSGARVEVYKTIGDVKLNIYIYEPEAHSAEDARPAVVFFFGGGWRQGSPEQFRHHCAYLASRGMVAMTADYRVRDRQGVKAVECVKDAKSAVRWIRANAARLGVDPERLAAGGGSAGGHLAACTGVVPGFDEGEHLEFSSVPNAMALFNPAVVLAPLGDNAVWEDRQDEMRGRMGLDPVEISPGHHVKAGAPPAILFHGLADTQIPHDTAELFAKKMEEAGTPCTLCSYEGQGHGFFNFGRNDNVNFLKTLRALDVFFQGLGWLTGPAAIDDFDFEAGTN